MLLFANELYHITRYQKQCRPALGKRVIFFGQAQQGTNTMVWYFLCIKKIVFFTRVRSFFFELGLIILLNYLLNRQDKIFFVLPDHQRRWILITGTVLHCIILGYTVLVRSAVFKKNINEKYFTITLSHDIC